MDRVIAVVLAYLIGSIDFGVIVPRALGVDIYNEGSGNPGTSNVFRTVGKRAAAMVLLGDTLKGVAAVAIADIWIGGSTAVAAGFFAVAGHVFPAWHRLKGGKGVATALGAALWLEPILGGILSIGWLLVVLVTKTASLASMGALSLYVPGFAIAGERDSGLWWAAATAGLVIVRHRSNIQAMISGGERSVKGS